jgi:hypothetical protein
MLRTLTSLVCAAQAALAKASLSIRKPTNAAALSRESAESTATPGELKPKANKKARPWGWADQGFAVGGF